MSGHDNVSRAFKAGVTPKAFARREARRAQNPNYQPKKLDGWQMNALQRRKELDRLARLRLRSGLGVGPEIGWIEVIANYVRVRNETVSAKDVEAEAAWLGLPKLDRQLVEEAVDFISREAWGRYPLYGPKLAGDKLHLTMAERDAAEIEKIEAIDEPIDQRRRRLDRERKRKTRAAQAALNPPPLRKVAIAKALGISRPTLDKWIAEGRVNRETGEITDITPPVRGSRYFVSERLTQNVNRDEQPA